MNNTDIVRTLANEIKNIEINGVKTTFSLTYVGSGSNCIAYKTIPYGYIIKEFYPLIDNIPAKRRKNEPNGELIDRDDLSPREKNILTNREKDFYAESEIICEINQRNLDQNDNMFLVPRPHKNTSLGKCQICNYIGGDSLEKLFGELRDTDSFYNRFMTVIPWIISLFREIELYHGDDKKNSPILNLDIKPENIYIIKSQGSYITARNLDFGSARRVVDEYDNGKSKPGIISQIREYARENSDSGDVVRDAQERFFASSPLFYDKIRVKDIVSRIIDGGSSDSEIISDLKQLDIIAGLKTLLVAFCPLSKLSSANTYKSESKLVNDMFADVFENNPQTLSNSLFESYNIYVKLYEIFANSLNDRQSFRLSAAEIAERLSEIYCMLDGVGYANKTDRQHRACEMNSIISSKDDMLKNENLETIKDILDFNINNRSKGISPKEPAEKLYWFLLTGEKHHGK